MIPVWHGKQIVNNPADSTLVMKKPQKELNLHYSAAEEVPSLF